MSSIQYRRNETSGTDSYRVRFRHHGRNRVVTFATEQHAKSWQGVLDAHGPDRALALLEVEAPTLQRSVAEQVRHHVEHLTGVTEGTRRRYQQVARTHLQGRFEAILLEHLSRDDVARWVNEQSAAGAAPKSIRNRHGLLSSALESAARDDLVPRNVAKGVRLPRADRADDDMVMLEPAEFRAIVACMDEHWRPLAWLLVGTGLRWGEATALRVGDVDLQAGTVRVQRSWKETSGAGWELGPPKTRRGRRTAKVSREALQQITPLVEGRGAREWLFVSKSGGPARGDWWRTDVWARAVAEWGGSKRPRVHDLRHTFASWAIRAGVPLTVLQRQLGHESIQTTSDTYGHIAPVDLDVMGEAIDAWVGVAAGAVREVEAR